MSGIKAETLDSDHSSCRQRCEQLPIPTTPWRQPEVPLAVAGQQPAPIPLTPRSVHSAEGCKGGCKLKKIALKVMPALYGTFPPGLLYSPQPYAFLLKPGHLQFMEKGFPSAGSSSNDGLNTMIILLLTLFYTHWGAGQNVYSLLGMRSMCLWGFGVSGGEWGVKLYWFESIRCITSAELFSAHSALSHNCSSKC